MDTVAPWCRGAPRRYSTGGRADLHGSRSRENVGSRIAGLSEEAAVQALQSRRQFNVIDLETGWKADLIVRKDRPFSLSEFERRQSASVLGVEVHIATAEDVVLTKLEWAKKGGGSERQLRDVRGILAAHAGLDAAYLDRWAASLGISDLLEEARR